MPGYSDTNTWHFTMRVSHGWSERRFEVLLPFLFDCTHAYLFLFRPKYVLIIFTWIKPKTGHAEMRTLKAFLPCRDIFPFYMINKERLKQHFSKTSITWHLHLIVMFKPVLDVLSLIRNSAGTVVEGLSLIHPTSASSSLWHCMISNP